MLRTFIMRKNLMHRRSFLTLATGALAAGALSSCAVRGEPRARATKPMDAAAFHASRRYARTSFGDIAYVERGTGDAALFLHGFPLNGFQWRGALDRLSDRRRCIAPDFMGLGYTKIRDGQDVSAHAQAAMLASLLDTLAIDAVDVVASDSGGAVAQIFMTRYRERVRTLLLTNCDVEPDSPPAAVLPVIEMAREGTYPDRWLAPWLADKTLARSAQGLGGLCYSNPAHPTDEAIDCYLGPLVSSARRKAEVNAYAIALSPNPLAGIESELRRCTVPTRIVWGTADTIFSPSSPDYLDRVLPDSRGVRRVPGAKLFFPEEFPDLVADEARALWRIG